MTIVPFLPIDRESMEAIVKLKLDQLGQRLMSQHGITLDLRSDVADRIARRCTEVETGARNVDHILQSNLLPRVSTEILEKMAEGALPSRLGVAITENGEFELEFSECTPMSADATA